MRKIKKKKLNAIFFYTLFYIRMIFQTFQHTLYSTDALTLCLILSEKSDFFQRFMKVCC